MRRTVHCLALLVMLVPRAGALGQVPAGYSLDSAVSLPDTLHEAWHGSRFRIMIERVAEDSLEQHLLTQAERLIPPKEDIEAASEGLTGAGWTRAFAYASALPGDRWWWREWDGVLLPYALTGATVQHLIERVRALSGQPNPFARSNPDVDHTASVEYRAHVTRTADPREPYQVQLEVHFRFYCGGRCALYFTHSRRVDFDASGGVVRVRGDGRPRYIVS